MFSIFFVSIIADHRRDWSWIYTHWLFDYHFGFIKRGLIGELISLVSQSPVTPLIWVQAMSWLMAIIVSLLFFKCFLDLRDKWTPSFLFFAVFVSLSPLSLRNYFYDLGRFDQLSMILILLQWFNIPIALTAIAAVCLVTVHENFFFLFLPALSFILLRTHGMKKQFLLFHLSR